MLRGAGDSRTWKYKSYQMTISCFWWMWNSYPWFRKFYLTNVHHLPIPIFTKFDKHGVPENQFYFSCIEFQLFTFQFSDLSSSHFQTYNFKFRMSISIFSKFQIPKFQNFRFQNFRISKHQKQHNGKFQTVRYTDLPTISEFQIPRYET